MKYDGYYTFNDGSIADDIEVMLEAAETYGQNPAALQLRAMNIIYETTKDRGATILIPSIMVDSLNPGGILGLVQAANIWGWGFWIGRHHGSTKR